MKKTLSMGTLFLAFSILFFSCGKNKMGRDGAVTYGAMNAAAPRASSKMMAMTNSTVAFAEDMAYDFDDVAVEAEMATEEAEESGGTSATGSKEGKTERKLIKTGYLTIEVSDLAKSENAVEAWCKHFDGYIANTSNSEQFSNFTVKVPSTKFDEAMKSIGEIGIVKNHGISTQDVSEQFYDLQTRLSTKKVMKSKLEKYLSQAKDIKDLLQIETELNSVISDIESMEGRIKRLSNQIDYSTINITMQLPYGKTDLNITFPNASNGLRRFISNIISFFAKCLVVFFYIIIGGIPVLAILAFLYWLLLGKVGLLKKLYLRLKK